MVPLLCRVPTRVEGDARARPLRVLELGGGIGAVSTMIQQMVEMLDPAARHAGTGAATSLDARQGAPP